MPAPVKEKSWQYSVNNGLFFGTNAAATLQLVMYQIKTSLISFALQPWTVSGSSNSSASSMDGTDRWTTAVGLIWAAGAHSWIVLRQTGVAAKFEICIDLNSASSGSLSLVVSPVNGFGTANGGTNGTTSARPTATDEVVVINTTSWSFGTSNNVAWVHLEQSTDGQCTRIFQASNNLVFSFWMFDRVKNPNPNWTGTPAVFCAASTNGPATSAMEYALWLDAATRCSFKHNVTAGNFFFATPGYGSTALGRSTAGLVPHDITKEWPFTKISLWSETVGVRGMWGNLYDCYWGSAALNSLSSYEASGVPNTWAQFGNLVFPWNGTLPSMG